jgi:predicted kinase
MRVSGSTPGPPCGLDQRRCGRRPPGGRERHSTGGSITYPIGLPGVGKSTWAREVWAPATGGVVLSSEGGRRRDRKAAAAAVLQQIPEQLAAGRDICVDATHLLRETRDVITTFAGRYGADLPAVYFHRPG